MQIAIALAAGLVFPFLCFFSATLLRDSREAPIAWGGLSLLAIVLNTYLLFLSPWGLLSAILATIALLILRKKREGPNFVVSERD